MEISRHMKRVNNFIWYFVSVFLTDDNFIAYSLHVFALNFSTQSFHLNFWRKPIPIQEMTAYWQHFGEIAGPGAERTRGEVISIQLYALISKVYGDLDLMALPAERGTRLAQQRG